MLEEIVIELGAEYCNKTLAGIWIRSWITKGLDPNLDSVDMVLKSSCSHLQILEAVLEEIVLELGAKYYNKTLARIRIQGWIH